MRPLNGKCAMTRDEANARRRELDADPFHRALTRRTAKKWRDRNLDKINAKRRAWYAETAERERARQRAWNAAHKDKRAAAWKKWADANRERLRARDAARYATAADKVRRDRMIAARRERLANDPEYHEKIKAQKRDLYHRNKNGAKFLRWYLKFILVPRWRRIDGDEAERKYLVRCNDRTRRLYILWKRDAYGVLRDLVGEEREVSR